MLETSQQGMLESLQQAIHHAQQAEEAYKISATQREDLLLNYRSLDAEKKHLEHTVQEISSEKAREAFDIEKESTKLRDEYGRNTAGQRFLLARRLVEAGVRMVSVTFGGWDHHSNIKGAFDGQAPSFDQAFARLITDLQDRGMLKRTLVLVSSEFGRTPKINGTNGRDHWPRVFSVAMAGGGMKEGYIHGASDALGGEPDRDAVGPEDLAKTMYRVLGINSEKRIMSDGGRPIDIVNGGRIMTDWLA